MYLFKVANIGLVGLFLFDDQLETQRELPSMLRKDLHPSLVRIEDGQIRHIRDLKFNEWEGEYQDQQTGRKYMWLSVNGHRKQVFFDTFYSFPYEDIVRLLSEGKKVHRDLMLSCFLKQTDKVAAIIPLMERDAVIGGFLSTCNPDNQKNVLCIPTETESYPKASWHYKMTFAPIQEQMKMFAASMTTYTDDICSMINSGTIQLVDKKAISERLNQAAEETLKKVQKRSIFKKKVKNTKMLQLPALYTNGICGITALQATLLDEEISCIITGDNVA